VRWLVFAAVLLPFADLWALYALGAHFGWLHAVGYALLGVVAGSMLTRAEGLRVLLRLRESLNGGEAPTDGVLSGILVVVGGLLLAWPGPISDALGLALFVPPLRRGLATWLRERIERRLAAATVGFRAMRVESIPLGGVVDLGEFARAVERGAQPRPAYGGVIETEGEVVAPADEDRPRLPGSR
jgi:UPF0716 protein FxsA